MRPAILIVDRLEAGFAVCELPGRAALTLPVAELPAGVGEGDCLRLDQTSGRYVVDQAETDRRRAANRDLFRRLLAKEPDDETR